LLSSQGDTARLNAAKGVVYSVVALCALRTAMNFNVALMQGWKRVIVIIINISYARLAVFGFSLSGHEHSYVFGDLMFMQGNACKAIAFIAAPSWNLGLKWTQGM
jgi:hypothetical protein